MPGKYKTTRHKPGSTVTPDVLSGEQDNTAKIITLPGLSPAREGALPPPELTLNESTSLRLHTPSSSLNDGSAASVSSAPFSGVEDVPSSVLPASETPEKLPVSRLIRQAWEPVDNSNNESREENDSDRDNANGGETHVAAKMAGNGTDSLFSFIDDALLEEAREFRRKGHNRQVPEVDPGLVTQLREAVATAKSRQNRYTSTGEPLGSLWMMQQIWKIERLTVLLSDDSMRDWVRDTLPDNGRGEAGEISPGNRNAAWSLVRRLESVLQTLIRVAHTLCSVDAYDTPGKRHDMLVAELTRAFPSGDESRVVQTLGRMMAEASGQAAWSSLMAARAAAWETEQAATFGAMSQTTRHEAEKAGQKARQLQGAAQAFFTASEVCFYSLSSDFRRASVDVSQGTVPQILQKVNDDAPAVLSSRSDSRIDKFETDVIQKKLKFRIVAEGVKTQIHRFNRVRVHGHPSETLSKTSAQITADSVIRSILWQWQQPAIKIQYASGALLSKVDQLQEIEGMFSPFVVEQDRGPEQEDTDVPVSHPGGDDRVAEVRQWVNERVEQAKEQAKPENQQAEKLAVLKKLLDGDIDNARALTGRLREKAENMESLLRKQRFAVLSMVAQRSGLDQSLKAVDKLLPKMASDLNEAIAVLDKACQAATTRDFSEAKKRASTAQLLATKVKEKLSAESARLTERPLDEHSRGSRQAKHWANLAREQSRNNDVSPDAAQVLSSLKKGELLEGVLSGGDPEGYLFATRLAGELENARNDELRLPMSPEQYAELEKGLVEYIVKWGQKRLSRGGARLVIELAFEHGLDTVSFRLSTLFRLPYKVLMASIKIPYSVHKVNNYTMPGQDKPYKAIYSLLGKKLKQLGFNLITAPLPGVVKLGLGAAVTAGAAVHNYRVGNKEKTFSAIYQRVAEGKKSEKIKMDSLAGMLLDSGIDVATTAAFKGTRLALRTGKNKFGGALNKPFVNDNSFDLYKVTLPKTQWGKAETENENTADVKVAASPASPLSQQSGVKPFGDSRDPTSGLPPIRHKRAAVEDEPAVQSHQETDKESVKATSPSDFDGFSRYQDFSFEQKTQVYRRAIENVLLEIEKDKKIPDNLRKLATQARLGEHKLRLVKGHRNGLILNLNNTLVLCDPSHKRSAVLIQLNSEVPYQYLEKEEDYNQGIEDVPGKFYIVREWGAIDISTISSRLAKDIEDDYRLKNKTIENKLLIARANNDFNHGASYQYLSDEQQKQTYRLAIETVLLEIEKDKKIPDNLRKLAAQARLGDRGLYLAQCDMSGKTYALNNTVLLLDPLKQFEGVLIRLNSEIPYQYLEKMEDFLQDFNEGTHFRVNVFPDPSLRDIPTISSLLAKGIDDDYRYRKKIIENNLLMARAKGIIWLSDTEDTGTQFVSVPGMKNKIEFASDADYQNLSEDQKREAYYNNLSRINREIWRDETIPVHIRSLLSDAASEKPVYMDVVIGAENYKLNNTLLIPDPTGKSLGVLVRMNSKKPYVYLETAKDIPQDLINDMPYSANNPGLYYHPELGEFRGTSSADYFYNIKSTGYNPLGSVHQEPMGMSAASDYLVKTIEADYKDKNKAVDNKLLVYRAAQLFKNNPWEHTKIGSEKEPKIEQDQVAQERVHLGNIDFNHGVSYHDLSREEKIHVYEDAIKFKLLKIEEDKTLPEHIRNRAYMGRLGAKILIRPEDLADKDDSRDDIIAIKQSNTIFLPDNISGKSGILIYLNSEEPHKYINKGKYDSEDPERDMKLSSLRHAATEVSPIFGRLAFWVLEKIGIAPKERDIPEPMKISDISIHFADNIEFNYTLTNRPLDHRLLISNSIAGSLIPEPNTKLIEVLDESIYRKSDSGLTDYLRFVQHPFSTLCGDFQLISSIIRGETMQETDMHVHEAEYWGSWVDVTVGAVTSFTPEGIILNVTESLAGILADLSEGKEPDTLAIVGLIASCLPGAEGEIVVSIGKVSRIGGQFVKYTMRVGNKVIDLTYMSRSIKEAVETGDPLAIYQAILNSGMSAKDSYHIARNMSSKLKISKPMEDSASLEQLEAIHSNAPGYAVSPEMPVRPFKIGQTQLHGKINKGEIEISRDGGATWERGSELHRLAYRLQNAGGASKLPVEGESTPEENSQPDKSTVNTQPSSQPDKSTENAQTSSQLDKSTENAQTSSQPDKSSENVQVGSKPDKSLENAKAGSQPGKGLKTGPITEYNIKLSKSTKAGLTKKFKGTKIKVFNPKSANFKESNGFALVRISTGTAKDTAGVTPNVIDDSLINMKSYQDYLFSKLSSYDGADKLVITKELENSYPVFSSIQRKLAQAENASDTHIYMLVKKGANPDDISHHYGLAELHFSPDTNTLSLKNVIVHPKVLLNKYPAFRDYVLKINHVHNRDLDEYNMENVAEYLGSKSLEKEIKYYESLSSGKVNAISFNENNLITQKFGRELALAFNSGVSENPVVWSQYNPPLAHEKIYTRTENVIIPEQSIKELDKIKEDLLNDFRLHDFIVKPKLNCANSAKKVTEILRDKADYSNIHFAELGIWNNKLAIPSQHFVVFGTKKINGGEGSIDFAVDITAAQFHNRGIDAPIIDTKENWKRIYHDKFSGGDRLVKYVEFDRPYRDTDSNVGKDIIPATLDPFEIITQKGTEILVRPKWHKDAYPLFEKNKVLTRAFDKAVEDSILSERKASNPWTFVTALQKAGGVDVRGVEQKTFLGPQSTVIMDEIALNHVPKGSRMVLERYDIEGNLKSSHPMLSLGGGYVVSVNNTWLNPPGGERKYREKPQKFYLMDALLTSPSLKTEFKRSFEIRGSSIRIRVQGDNPLKMLSKLPEESESTSQGRSQSDVSSDNAQARSQSDNIPENSQGGALHYGPSGRDPEAFGHVTNHQMKLNKLNRFVLNKMFSGETIQKFDPKSSRFENSNDFTLVHTGIKTKKVKIGISSDKLIVSLDDMKIKTKKLTKELESYRGLDKEAISGNLEILNSMFENLKEKTTQTDNTSMANIYLLVGKNSEPGDINNHYGLAELEFAIDNKDLSINSLAAHPYVILNKYPAYREFLIEKGIILRSDVERYNIKNVARYVGAKSVKSEISYYNSLPSTKVKTLSFDGANPITQRLGHMMQRLSEFFSKRQPLDNSDDLFDFDEVTEQRFEASPNEMTNFLKSYVGLEFKPVQPAEIFTDEIIEKGIKKEMADKGAEIISDNIFDGKNSADTEIKNFSTETISSVDRAYEKVSSVKALFDQAESNPEIKNALKSYINEATGLNDDVINDIDRVDVTHISEMAYQRFKYNVNSIYDYLRNQKSENYPAFVLIKYHENDGTKPQAYAFPNDRRKRILIAVQPETLHNRGLDDTVTHEASHNAADTRDHSYMGDVRTETGAFPSSFDFSSRNPKYFAENDKLSETSTRYVLGLSQTARVTEDQQSLAQLLLHNSRLVKSDTHLNTAEYNAFMINVLSRGRIKDSRIELDETSSRNKRSGSGIDHGRDNMIMVYSFKATFPELNLSSVDSSDYYIVQPGDTLKSIAKKSWGLERFYTNLYALNNDVLSDAKSNGVANGSYELSPGLRLRLKAKA